MAWADGGAPEGNPKDAPAPVQWVEGWNIGKPDMVFEMPKPFDVPPPGTIDYNYVIIPTGFHEGHVGPGSGSAAGQPHRWCTTSSRSSVRRDRSG